jgi:acyl-coenzyme A thioesterase 13
MIQLPEELPRSALLDMIGGELDSWEEGRAVMLIKLEERHMNPRGVLHGGVLTTLMDEATAHAIATVRGLESPLATVDMNVSFLSAARPGDELLCEARTLRVGSAVAFAEAEVRRSGRGDLVAKGRFTYSVLGPRGA